MTLTLNVLKIFLMEGREREGEREGEREKREKEGGREGGRERQREDVIIIHIMIFIIVW